MRHGLINTKWRDLMPPVFHKLDKCAFSAGTASVESDDQGIHIIPITSQDDGTVVVSSKTVDSAIASAVVDSLKKLNWTKEHGTVHLQANNKQVVAVVCKKMDGILDQQADRQYGLDLGKATRSLECKKVNIYPFDGADALGILDGYCQSYETGSSFKSSEGKQYFPENLQLVADGIDDEAVKNRIQFVKAAFITRFLQDAPGNYLDPVKFAEIGEDIAKEFGLKHKILDKKALEAEGMGSFLAVADGSEIEPRLIVLEIPGKDTSKTVALVGKGLTFDAGGISIKPSVSMDEMKYDMSGGAAVLGSAYYFGKVQPPVNVVCLIGASENLPSGSAIKPGDIVKARNGKTIEVLNTDAEGRLVLADVLSYAVDTYKPDLMLDIATLTGAVLMALGSVGAAVMSKNNKIAEHVIESGRLAGEPMWQLPMWPEFMSTTNGDFSDLKNIAKPNVKAGSVIGAVFLSHFVGDTPWAHLDIAGASWSCQAQGYPSTGGSAFGLRTLVSACERFEGIPS